MAKKNNERLKRYQISTITVPISDTLAEKLHATTSSAIDTYKSAGKLAMFYDGYQATFRTVVGEDVWTLSIHCPMGYIEKLSDTFKQIIADVEANTFDEIRYTKLVDN